MTIVGAILDALTGGFATKVLDFLASRDDARLKSMNDAEKRAFDERQTIRQNSKEIRLATAGFWEMRLLTFLVALPFVIHVNLVGLDTNFRFGWGIPKFPAPFDEWEGAILLSFFGVATLGGVAKAAIASTVLRRIRSPPGN